MSIRIHNSLTKKSEEFVPLHGKTVNMYVCGPTVYDECHIGHARSLYCFDVIRRYLKYRGFKVNFVRNITDVDDKIIHKANELHKSSQMVAEENIAAYYEDLDSLSIDRADREPKATENIPDMIKHIQGLLKKGYAYEADGDVYFSVRKFPQYGKLSGQSIDQMQEAVRIEKDSKKKDPLDFALWKKSKDNEPSWEGPWGKGRPGWHIECSVMSMKHLKSTTLDIHAGGRDLIFPHHENEIAQSESLTGKPFARHWLHHGLITVNGQKMAKSAGNFVTIKDVLEKFTADDVKLFFLSAHYTSSVDFSFDALADAHKALGRFDVLFWKAAEILKGDAHTASHQRDFIERNKNKFLEAMDDDFNTAKALAALFDLVSDTNKFIDQEKKDSRYHGVVFSAVDTIEDLARNVFGLFLREPEKELTLEEETLLEERKDARASKDFRRSDELRELLRQKGISVEDTRDGQTWRWI